ncbi:hypothetical protein D3C87_2061420 [compost metagenome]
MAYAFSAIWKPTGMKYEVTSGHPAVFAELGPVIAQSVTPRSSACWVSPKGIVTGMPPSFSMNLARDWS